MVLMTGLPGIGRKVEVDGEEVSIEVGDMIRRCMDEWERQEMARSVPSKSGKKQRFFQHYLNMMIQLCDEHAEEDPLGIWLKLYAFIVLSGVFSPRTPYGATWSVMCCIDDVVGMDQYAWAKAIWRVVVDAIDDTNKKIRSGLFSEVQLNGFCLLIQVWWVVYA